MSKPIIKKYARLKKLLPEIESKFEDGYIYEGVIEFLKEEHDLELTFGVFKNYLSKARKEITTEMPSKISTIEPRITHQSALQESQKLTTNVDKDEKSNTDDDDTVSPEVLAQLKADLEKQKNSLVSSKSIFDN